MGELVVVTCVCGSVINCVACIVEIGLSVSCCARVLEFAGVDCGAVDCGAEGARVVGGTTGASVVGGGGVTVSDLVMDTDCPFDNDAVGVRVGHLSRGLGPTSQRVTAFGATCRVTSAPELFLIPDA